MTRRLFGLPGCDVTPMHNGRPLSDWFNFPTTLDVECVVAFYGKAPTTKDIKRLADYLPLVARAYPDPPEPDRASVWEDYGPGAEE